jgi:hypothetical protein
MPYFMKIGKLIQKLKEYEALTHIYARAGAHARTHTHTHTRNIDRESYIFLTELNFPVRFEVFSAAKIHSSVF